MALNRVSSEEFSFPSLASNDLPHHSGLESPPLWKHSPEISRRERYNRSFGRLINAKYDDDDDDDDNDQTKSFSYVEMRSRWCDYYKEEEKMDMLWEDLNEELPSRSQSLRIESGGDGEEKKPSLVSDESSVVVVGCGMKLAKNTPKKKKKKNPNVLLLMRVLKKILVLRTSSQRSLKTHPR